MQVAGQTAKAFTYDKSGNIASKTGPGTYTYPTPGAGAVQPHAVTSVSGIEGGTYTYDADGNAITSAGRTLTWTAANRPLSIVNGAHTLTFAYDPERNRIQQTVSDDPGSSMLYLDDPVSGARAEFFPSTTSWKDYVMAPGGIAAIVPTDPASLRFVHKDSLGSTEALTDSTGTRVEQDSYGPWGLRRNVDGTDDTQGTLTSQTDKGFTGHQHLPEVTLISMGARIYDPALGRFVSPDPTIPVPANGQAYNRYAYVLNNPLAHTDPNGYGFFSSLFHPIAEVFNVGGHLFDDVMKNDLARTAVAVAAAYFTGYYNFAAYGHGILGTAEITAGNAAIGGFVGGTIQGRSLKSGLIGSVTAVGFYEAGFVGAEDSFERAAAHAVVGCASAALGGGRCENGAFAAGVAQFAGTRLGDWGDANVIKYAALGGTASVINGGKFANGAFTASYGYLFNELVHNDRDRGYIQMRYPDGTVCGGNEIGCQDEALGHPLGTPEENVEAVTGLAGTGAFGRAIAWVVRVFSVTPPLMPDQILDMPGVEYQGQSPDGTVLYYTHPGNSQEIFSKIPGEPYSETTTGVQGVRAPGGSRVILRPAGQPMMRVITPGAPDILIRFPNG